MLFNFFVTRRRTDYLIRLTDFCPWQTWLTGWSTYRCMFVCLSVCPSRCVVEWTNQNLPLNRQLLVAQVKLMRALRHRLLSKKVMCHRSIFLNRRDILACMGWVPMSEGGRCRVSGQSTVVLKFQTRPWFFLLSSLNQWIFFAASGLDCRLMSYGGSS